MSKFSRILVIILAGCGVLLFLFSLLGVFGVSGGLPGFLFRTFHIAAFYIPLYLGVCSLILLVRGRTGKILLGLNLSLLPFVNLALILHVMTGNRDVFISRYLITELGIGVSLPFLFLLMMVECALIYKLCNFLFPAESWIPDLSELKDSLSALTGIVNMPVKKKDEEKQGFRDPLRREIFEEDDTDSPSFSIPDMPEPIPPVEAVDDSEIQSLIASVLHPGKKESLRFDPGTGAPSSAESRDGIRKEVSDVKLFNPNKTMGIDELVDSVYDEPVSDSVSESVVDTMSPTEEDPGIGFLMGDAEDSCDDLPLTPLASQESSPEREDLSQEIPPVIPDDDEYEAQGYLGDRMDDLDDFRASDSAAAGESLPAPPAAEPLSGIQTVNEPEPEEAVRVADKLSPEGETEKMGVESPALKPRHKRKNQPYSVPVAGLLKEYPAEVGSDEDDYTQRQARALEDTLKEFKIEATVTGIRRGPVITMFEVQPSPGVKVSRIVNLQDNLALRLAASRIRIVAPIPGKQAIGIEVPNRKRSIVSYSDLVSSGEFEGSHYEIPVILGKDISGGNQVIDLARTPHLLIAGSTGSGKSVCVNSLICSILYKRSPQDVKLIMVDPKIVELKLYNDIPHLLTPVITEPKKAFQAVQWALYEMERRYSLLDAMGVRDIKSYNKRIKEREIATSRLPYIVVVIDEFADLMATSGKELEGIVARLAAMSRAVGIHLVLATQRPSIDVITGLIKANFPSRIAFMVASKTDSRIIIDMMGAESLQGKGDMLFTSAWDPFPTRMQGAFLSEDEVERVVSYVKTLGEPEYIDDEIFLDEDDFESGGGGGESSYSDPLYEKALDIVISAGKASASYLQRRLQIGYNRAARLVEEMEIQGIVGPQNGSKPREVVHIPDRPGREMLDTGPAAD